MKMELQVLSQSAELHCFHRQNMAEQPLFFMPDEPVERQDYNVDKGAGQTTVEEVDYAPREYVVHCIGPLAGKRKMVERSCPGTARHQQTI